MIDTNYMAKLLVETDLQ